MTCRVVWMRPVCIARRRGVRGERRHSRLRDFRSQLASCDGESSNSFAHFARSHDVERNRMDDHEVAPAPHRVRERAQVVRRRFNIGGVDHTHGGWKGAGKTDRPKVCLVQRPRCLDVRAPHRAACSRTRAADDDAHSDGMQGYLVQVAERAAAFAIAHGRDAGAWIVELSGDGAARVRARRGGRTSRRRGTPRLSSPRASPRPREARRRGVRTRRRAAYAAVVMMDDPSRRGRRCPAEEMRGRRCRHDLRASPPTPPARRDLAAEEKRVLSLAAASSRRWRLAVEQLNEFRCHMHALRADGARGRRPHRLERPI